MLGADGRVLPGLDVLTSGHVIRAVAPTGTWDPAGHDVVECGGSTLMPGVIDAHVHLTWAGRGAPPRNIAEATVRALNNAEQLLAAGVTTARDVGGSVEVLTALATSRSQTPEILFAGEIICATGGHGSEFGLAVPIAREVDGADALRAAVRSRVRAGAHVIKLCLNGASGKVELTEAEVRAVVDEAHRHGRRVACHASVRAAIDLAVRCAVDTVEHGNGLDQPLAAHMAAQGTCLVVTAAIFRELLDELNSGVPGPFAHQPDVEPIIRERVALHADAVAVARAEGVTIAFGTDRVAGQRVHAVVEEARALQALGLEPREVLLAATQGSATALGLGDRGQVVAGMRADLIAVEGRPDEDLAALGRLRHVIQGGVLRR